MKIKEKVSILKVAITTSMGILKYLDLSLILEHYA